MKNVHLLILLILMLSAFQCKREGPDCHYYIVINNQSEEEIIVAISGGGSPVCLSDDVPLKGGESREYRPSRSCIEREMTDSSLMTIYLIDHSQFNKPDQYFTCDSLVVGNVVLERYDLTLADLQNLDFTIDYP